MATVWGASFRKSLDMRTRRLDDASVLDENQRLRMQLRKCDASRLQKESQIAHLRARAHQAEAAVVQQLRMEEAKYMIEFDHNVQALLKILKHHEEENEKLKKEVKQLRVAAAVAPPSITKITRSTQTKTMDIAFKRDSVSFDKAKDLASDSKVAFSVEVNAKASSIARMQQLFERLQASIDQAESTD